MAASLPPEHELHALVGGPVTDWLGRRGDLSTDHLAPTSFIWQCY